MKKFSKKLSAAAMAAVVAAGIAPCAAAANVKWGDINGDGSIDILDIVIMRDHIVNGTPIEDISAGTGDSATVSDPVQGVIDEANSYAESGNWDKAIEILEAAQITYSGNKSLQEAYEEILFRMTITLKNITTISSHSFYETTKDVVKDRYGNIYDGAVKFCAGSGNDNEVYALYNLNKKFKKFTATAFVGKDLDAVEECSISIYLDDELVLYKDAITVDTAPIKIDLDVTGKSTLRIKVDNRWFAGAEIYFGNSYFTKAN